ncbi:MAG TPA: queuosine precursor transporter [Gammaproteobacteria bacterium]|nr:queuosine precursor transporter [Gammaproteobacteria bacterium]HRA43062.1 queuosine precursor transporter [Gammaproteobacteria bacterium]
MQAVQQTISVAQGSANCSSRLWFLISFYAVVLVLSNWFDLRLIKIFGLVANSGTPIFALTFFLANLITEIYGYKYARLAIWWGFSFNLFVFVYGQLVILMPSLDHYHTEIFDTLLKANNRAIVAGLLGYLCSEPLNSFVMAKLKIEFRGQFMGGRFLLSTLIASVADSVVFGFIAFYGIFDQKVLISMIFGVMIVKMTIYFLALPFFLHFAKKLKQKEHMDIYDKGTKFNFFRLDTHYAPTANQFK